MAVAMHRLPLTWSRNACDLELPQLVDEARDSFRAELDIPMTAARPPVLTSLNGHGERVPDETEPVALGLPMSAQLYRRIHPSEGYGNVFPMARALDDLRGWCSGQHVNPSSGPWEDHLVDVALGPDLQRPLCARLAWYVIAWRTTPAWAARQERLAFHRAARWLTSALQHAYEQRREWAHGDASGVPEVLAELRRSRRAARARAEGSTSSQDVVCRHCRRRYDPLSVAPCPGAVVGDAVAAAYPGAEVLCSPAMPR